MKTTIVSQSETMSHYFSENFASGREPTKEEVREHLLFRNKNPTSDRCSILCDNRDNMVKQGWPVLVQPPDFWTLPLGWSWDSVDYLHIWSFKESGRWSHRGVFIFGLDDFPYWWGKLNLQSLWQVCYPFISFEEGLLNHLASSPSQILLSSWAFAKVFRYWCDYRRVGPSVRLFFNFFLISRTSKDFVRGQGIISICHSNRVFDVYMEVGRTSRTIIIW